MPYVKLIVKRTPRRILRARAALQKAQEIIEDYLEAVRGEAFEFDRNERLLVREIAAAILEGPGR